jgi:hypothetical protein
MGTRRRESFKKRFPPACPAASFTNSMMPSEYWLDSFIIIASSVAALYRRGAMSRVGEQRLAGLHFVYGSRKRGRSQLSIFFEILARIP